MGARNQSSYNICLYQVEFTCENPPNLAAQLKTNSTQNSTQYLNYCDTAAQPQISGFLHFLKSHLNLWLFKFFCLDVDAKSPMEILKFSFWWIRNSVKNNVHIHIYLYYFIIILMRWLGKKTKMSYEELLFTFVSFLLLTE